MGQTKWTKKFKVIVANKYKFSETQSDPRRKYTKAYCSNVRLPDCCRGRDSLECLVPHLVPSVPWGRLPHLMHAQVGLLLLLEQQIQEGGFFFPSFVLLRL